ncbi:MAG: hypothetical protein V1735_06155 [Nanoarchaeota archaeon]
MQTWQPELTKQWPEGLTLHDLVQLTLQGSLAKVCVCLPPSSEKPEHALENVHGAPGHYVPVAAMPHGKISVNGTILDLEEAIAQQSLCVLEWRETTEGQYGWVPTRYEASDGYLSMGLPFKNCA